MKNILSEKMPFMPMYSFPGGTNLLTKEGKICISLNKQQHMYEIP